MRILWAVAASQKIIAMEGNTDNNPEGDDAQGVTGF